MAHENQRFQPGDRVMIVWACCTLNRQVSIGMRAVIEQLLPPGKAKCSNCGSRDDGQTLAHLGGKHAVPVTWLVKDEDPDKTKNEDMPEVLAI